MSITPEVTVADLGERALIARIKNFLHYAQPSIIVGVGDDAAVVKQDRGMVTVITTDAAVEDIHFKRAFVSPYDIGYKALAMNLSDLAAMGSSPKHALLSLMLPSGLSVMSLDEILEGFASLSNRHSVSLIGGNVTQSSGPLVIDITAIGSVHKRRILRRNGSQPGDGLYLSGYVGGAAAGLAVLNQMKSSHRSDIYDTCRQCYLRPEPRVRLGTLLGRNRVARSCIDLSDGLIDAISHLSKSSNVGAALDATTIPIEPGALKWFQNQGIDPLKASLSHSDDYELLFTVSPTKRRSLETICRLNKDINITRIGTITKNREITLKSGNQDISLPQGYEHFRQQ